MRNIILISTILLISGCTTGDYVPELTPSKLTLTSDSICVYAAKNEQITSYTLYEGTNGQVIKFKQTKPVQSVCLNNDSLLNNTVYIGHYTIANAAGKKTHYGFNIIDRDGSIYSQNSDGRYIQLIEENNR